MQSLQIVSISSLIESSMAVFIKLNRYYASQESYSQQLIRCFDHCLIDNQYRMLEGLVGILLSYKTSFNEISGKKSSQENLTYIQKGKLALQLKGR
jgi:hypothetical protein